MKYHGFVVFIACIFTWTHATLAEELEMVNRPMNTTCLTGLMVTTAPFTLNTGMVEAGLASISENSNKPDYTLTEYAVCMAVGIGRSMELAVRGSFLHLEDGLSIEERGIGDTEVSWKWNIIHQNEDDASPGVSLFLAGIAPTGIKQPDLGRVQNWGMKLGISVGSEIPWEDHMIGIYADGQAVFQDFSNVFKRDVYHIINAGILLPISKYRNLQLILEYNIVSGRDVKTKADIMDHTAVTSGIRLVSEQFNLSIGMQLLNKEKTIPEIEDSTRIIGIVSIKL